LSCSNSPSGVRLMVKSPHLRKETKARSMQDPMAYAKNTHREAASLSKAADASTHEPSSCVEMCALRPKARGWLKEPPHTDWRTEAHTVLRIPPLTDSSACADDGWSGSVHP
jgi:hypothetical protein